MVTSSTRGRSTTSIVNGSVRASPPRTRQLERLAQPLEGMREAVPLTLGLTLGLLPVSPVSCAGTLAGSAPCVCLRVCVARSPDCRHLVAGRGQPPPGPDTSMIHLARRFEAGSTTPRRVTSSPRSTEQPAVGEPLDGRAGCAAANPTLRSRTFLWNTGHGRGLPPGCSLRAAISSTQPSAMRSAATQPVADSDIAIGRPGGIASASRTTGRDDRRRSASRRPVHNSTAVISRLCKCGNRLLQQQGQFSRRDRNAQRPNQSTATQPPPAATSTEMSCTAASRGSARPQRSPT